MSGKLVPRPDCCSHSSGTRRVAYSLELATRAAQWSMASGGAGQRVASKACSICISAQSESPCVPASAAVVVVVKKRFDVY